MTGGDDPFRLFAGPEGRGLRDRDLRREGILVGEGRLVAGRVAAKCRLLAVLAEPSAAAEAEALAAGRCPVRVSSAAEIERSVGYAFHRGLLVAAERPPFQPVSELRSGFSRIVVFPNPTDPENLGAVVRSAAALGWDGIVIGPEACDPFGRRALRCSMGAMLTMPLFRTGPEGLDDAISGGLPLVAAELSADAVEAGSARARELFSADRPLAIVFGNERDGIPDDWRRRCGAAVAIPQARGEADGVDSLNVAAAAAILLWEGRPC